MKLLRVLQVALRSLAANKLRSVLAVLGVVIGVSSVVIMMAMGRGAQQSVQASITAMGTNLLFVEPGMRAAGHGAARTQAVETLTVEDAQAIARLQHIRGVSPQVNRQYQVKYLNKNTNARVLGVWPDYSEIRNFFPGDGVFLSKRDVVGRSRVCVLGAKAAQELFGTARPIDKFVKIDRKNFLVIGVMQEKGAEGGWMNPDDMVLVPVSTAQRRLMKADHVSSIVISVDATENIDRAMEEIETLLRRRHRLPAGRESDFNVNNQAEWLSRVRDITGAFTILLAGIATVSLLVGGIGIMNIMLVSVTERTREIGTRRAVGAKRRDILWQFLVESIAISGLGCLLGLAAGVGGSFVIPLLPIWQTLATVGRGGKPWDAVIAPEAVLLSLGFSFFVGVFFGLYPAIKASRLSPVEALRYE